MANVDDIIDLTHAPWLRSGNGALFLRTFATALDELEDKMDQAARAHIPGAARTDTAIPYQAEDRVLVQGPAETNAQFIARLRRAFDSWRKAGSREAIIEQMKGYRTGLDPGVTQTDPSMLIVGGNGTYSTWQSATFADTPEDSPTRRRVTPANWNWDGVDQPWRSWLVLFMRDVPIGVSGSAMSVTTVGGSGVSGVTSGFSTLTGLASVPADPVGMWITVSGADGDQNNGRFQIVLRLSDTSVMVANPGPGIAPDLNNGMISWSISEYPFFRPALAWGSPSLLWGNFTWGLEWAGHTPEETTQVITSIRQILKRWKSARTYYPNILVSFDGGDGTAGNQFSPLSAAGSGNPNGDYGAYGSNVNGVWVPRAQTTYPLTCFLDGTGQYLRCNVHNVT